MFFSGDLTDFCSFRLSNLGRSPGVEWLGGNVYRVLFGSGQPFSIQAETVARFFPREVAPASSSTRRTTRDPGIASVVVEPRSLTLYPPEYESESRGWAASAQFAATALFQGIGVADPLGVDWTVSDPTRLTVSYEGLVRVNVGAPPGTATVIASARFDNRVSDSATVTIPAVTGQEGSIFSPQDLFRDGIEDPYLYCCSLASHPDRNTPPPGSYRLSRDNYILVGPGGGSRDSYQLERRDDGSWVPVATVEDLPGRTSYNLLWGDNFGIRVVFNTAPRQLGEFEFQVTIDD
ncbi:MAG: hypothetical protein FJZ01_20085 [Candidatus Sericytochromatia bacterium]|nr:hypothetical protein [Candidatus Tanganyikabacteria bacterium]